MHKTLRPKGYFQLEIITNVLVLALSASFEYPCYESTAILIFLILAESDVGL